MVEGLAKVVRNALCLANFIILICGISVLAVGLWTLTKRTFMQRLLESELYRTSTYLLIATGVMVIVISCLGCRGAMTGSRFLLFLYFIILFMIFILTLAGGTLGYVFRNEVEKQIPQRMVNTVPKYGEDPAVTDSWDAVQKEFKCCGVTVNYDESYAIWQKQNKKLGASGKVVPDSCCKKRDPEGIRVCQGDPKNKVFNGDCYLKMKDYVKEHASILGGIGIGIACVLIVDMMLACAFVLIDKERKEK